MSAVAVEVLNRLQRRCEELENQLAQERQKRGVGETEGTVLEYKQRAIAAEADKLKIEEENCRLRIEVSELSRKVEMLSKELDRRRVSATDGTPSVTSNDEHVHLLEEQVRQFQFDFESERRDRQHAQARVDDLLHQLTAANRELQQRNIETMQSISQRRLASLQNYRDTYDSVHRTDSGHPPADVHGLDVLPDGEAYDEIDFRSGAQPDLTSNMQSNVSSPDVTNVAPQ